MTGVFLALATLCGADAALCTRQIRIDVCVLKGDPLGSRAEGTMKAVLEPSIVCFDRQEAFFQAGGGEVVKGPDGQDKAKPFGIKLTFSPELKPDGTIRAAVTSEYSVPAAGAQPGNGQPAAALNTTTCRQERVVKPGEKFRVRLAADSADSQTWAEITVTPVPRGK